MTSFIGSIFLFAGNFAPRGWAFCQGQLLPINQNQALFAILGTTYGGDGKTTFALPDLRGRVPVGFGAGPGLSGIALGEAAGSENVTLTVNQLPTHNHMVFGSQVDATESVPPGAFAIMKEVGLGSEVDNFTNTAPNAILGNQTISQTGGSQPHNNMQPYNTINYIIALQGIFPSHY